MIGAEKLKLLKTIKETILLKFWKFLQSWKHGKNNKLNNWQLILGH